MKGQQQVENGISSKKNYFILKTTQNVFGYSPVGSS